MLLSDWRVLVRRWYVLLIGLLGTGGLCFMIISAVPLQYDLESKILLLPPLQKVNNLPTNPYLNLGGLDGMSDVLSSAMGDEEIQKELLAAGHKADYTFSRDQTAAGPVVLLDLTADSVADSLATQKFLLEKVSPVLLQLQEDANVPPTTYITHMVFTNEEKPKPSRKKQMRLLLVAGVGGLGLTYLAAALLDGILRSRRKPPAGAAQALAAPIEPRQFDVPPMVGVGVGAGPSSPGPNGRGPGESFPRPGQPPGYPQRPQQARPSGQRPGGRAPAGYPGEAPQPSGAGREANGFGPNQNGYGNNPANAGRSAGQPPRNPNGRKPTDDQGQGGISWVP